MSGPVIETDVATVYLGDCIEVMRTLPDASVDAVVTDPPYGLEFMGKEWDRPDRMGKVSGLGEADGTPFRRNTGTPAWGASGNPSCMTCGGQKYGKGNPCECDSPLFPNHMALQMRSFQQWCTEWAAECLRVLKPGGHMLAFGGSRTWHRLAAGVEDAGFEIRDSIAWLYGSGFPKSLDVSKELDKQSGIWRGRAGEVDSANGAMAGPNYERTEKGPAVTEAAKAWEGWGTALKPSFEPVVVARKPLVGTVAANVLAHGTGALNIDGCRVGDGSDSEGERPEHESSATARYAERGAVPFTMTPGPRGGSPSGRWPTNVVLDESQAEALDQQSGILTSGANPTKRNSDKFRNAYGDFKGQTDIEPARGADSGGASRFFPTFRYEAKAPTSERPNVDGVQHPTVKPLDLMRWLVRLVTPPDGVVLEPFAGSGTTLEAAVLEGFRCIGIEREADYLPLIEQRLSKPMQQSLFDLGGIA